MSDKSFNNEPYATHPFDLTSPGPDQRPGSTDSSTIGESQSFERYTGDYANPEQIEPGSHGLNSEHKKKPTKNSLPT